jgi:ligand-binding sensor domain-containing protein
MLKDVYGFLWIGTLNGLNRFDGNNFKIYFNDPNKKSSISGNEINGIIEDSLHNIWVGTKTGLSRYDIKADTFTNFFAANLNSHIVPFWATQNEIYCHEGDTLITAYNTHSFVKKIVGRLSSAYNVGLGMSFQFSIYDAGSNSVWLLQGGYDIPGGGLCKLSLSDDKMECFKWDCYKNIPGHSHCSEGMCFDKKRNCIWINSNDGLVQFTIDDQRFHHIDALDNLSDLRNYEKGYKDWHWVGIDLDSRGRVCIATVQRGIVIYDPAEQEAKTIILNDTTLQGEVSAENSFIYCDRDGIIWSGFWTQIPKGIYQLVPFSQVIKHYKVDNASSNSLSNNQLMKAVNGANGKMWLGTQDGLNIFDPRTESFEVLKEKDLPGLRGIMFIPLLVDTVVQKAWLHTGPQSRPNALFEMDLQTRYCRHISFQDTNKQTINPEGIFHPFSYKHGCMIAANYDNKQGIFIVNNESVIAREVLTLPANTIDIFSKCSDGDLFFFKQPDSLFNATFAEVNAKWVRIPTALDSIKWNHIVFNNADQTYWVISFQQLIRYNKQFRVINRYTIENGLPGLEIHDLVPDNKNNIWFNTDRAIYQLNLSTGIISMLSEKDGFEKQNLGDASAASDDNGNIYFTDGFTDEGFNLVNPNKYTSPFSSSVYFQSVQINQKSLPLSRGANSLEELSLRYFENKINIETGIIDFYSKGKSHIRYKLETNGKTTDWQYAPDYYTIRYEDLPPAKYKLTIQASNAANEFNGPEKVLKINISPAFWNTWWFRTLAAVFVLAVFYFSIRYRTQQKFKLRLEHLEKEKKITEKEKQVAELQRQKTEVEMQALRAQMNPHFIFNSLNSINRFILQNNKTEASEYLTKFSKLVRMILQNSQASLITLESELESLGLYLEMEALRFNHYFSYKISVQKDLDIEVLKVPPLIIQPYVENAIWHGLMHKEEKGELNIEISGKEGHLYFKITDNGIGRKKAAALASKSATKHKSMGLKITEQRIEMMQNANGKEAPVSIVDLTYPDGSAAGTEVTIKIPEIYD